VKEHFDGGKWFCGLAELGLASGSASNSSKCRAYSFGSNYDITFEHQIDARLNGDACEIHIYDPTMGSSRFGHSLSKLSDFVRDLPPNYVFHELGISAPGKESITIEDETFTSVSLVAALQANGHSETGIDFLKFDVEGSEYDILETAEWDRLKIGLILFEVHAGIIQRLRSESYTLLKFHEHLMRLETAGYRLYSVEPVCSGCIGQFEVSMMHKDWHPIHKFRNMCK